MKEVSHSALPFEVSGELLSLIEINNREACRRLLGVCDAQWHPQPLPCHHDGYVLTAVPFKKPKKVLTANPLVLAGELAEYIEDGDWHAWLRP